MGRSWQVILVLILLAVTPRALPGQRARDLGSWTAVRGPGDSNATGPYAGTAGALQVRGVAQPEVRRRTFWFEGGLLGAVAFGATTAFLATAYGSDNRLADSLKGFAFGAMIGFPVGALIGGLIPKEEP